MVFPFVAVEGQEKIKKALLLNVINKKIGGVLINGEKGTAKSTLVRGLGELFSDLEVVNLPLNITEDNLLGSIDIEKTLKSGEKSIQYGLLKRCHQNILYIDEINLLGDSIVSNILEVASREINYVEREGISFSHPSKFILVGTMNPEEGDLRPQLLDKFGLYVKVSGISDVLERVKIVKKRLEFERDPEKFRERYREEEEILKEKIESAKRRLEKIKVSEQIMNIVIKIVEEANVTGNRGEIVLVETAKALASLDGRTYINIDDLKEASEFVLPHRARKKEDFYENHKNRQENLENEMDPDIGNDGDREDLEGEAREKENREKEENKNLGGDSLEDKSEFDENMKDDFDDSKGEENKDSDHQDEKEKEEDFGIGDIFKVRDIFLDSVRDGKKRVGTGKRCRTKSGSLQGRYIKSAIPRGKIKDFALDATIRTAAPYQNKFDKGNLRIKIKKEHIRIKVREKRTGTTIVFVVDSSGSMGVKKRMEAVKGAVFSLLKDAYEKRDRVGIIAFRKDRAEEILPITRSIDMAQKKLAKITTGGKTPLAQGISKGYQTIKNELKKDREIVPLLVFLTDGKGNYSASQKDPIKESLKEAQKIKKSGIKSIVVDTEEGFIKLELAKNLSLAMGGDYYRLENLKSEDILEFVKKKRVQ